MKTEPRDQVSGGSAGGYSGSTSSRHRFCSLAPHAVTYAACATVATAAGAAAPIPDIREAEVAAWQTTRSVEAVAALMFPAMLFDSQRMPTDNKSNDASQFHADMVAMGPHQVEALTENYLSLVSSKKIINHRVPATR